MNNLKERVEQILSVTFGGLHNVPGEIKNIGFYFELKTHLSLSTFDDNTLALLVITSHDNCVRLTISTHTPKLLSLCFWDRKREGLIVERHPTIEDAIIEARKHYDPVFKSEAKEGE